MLLGVAEWIEDSCLNRNVSGKKIRSDSISASVRFVAFPPEYHSKISRTVRFFILAEAAFNIVRMA